ENAQTHDGVDAAQSGGAGGGGGAWLEATVAGPGTLTFWWKISGNADRTGTNYLIFYIDEVPQASIFGEVDWEQQSFDIPPGRHVLKWLYLGNTTVFTGHENAGWVDEVAFTPPATLVSPVLTTDGQFHVTLGGKV